MARLFLGDVGSLAIGLVVAFCLFDLATHGGLAAAVLLPLYYIADSGLTLVWRLRRGDRVWEAHRHHFYQVAVARGLTVNQVLARVVVTNLALACFAAASLWQGQRHLGRRRRRARGRCGGAAAAGSPPRAARCGTRKVIAVSGEPCARPFNAI